MIQTDKCLSPKTSQKFLHMNNTSVPTTNIPTKNTNNQQPQTTSTIQHPPTPPTREYATNSFVETVFKELANGKQQFRFFISFSLSLFFQTLIFSLNHTFIGAFFLSKKTNKFRNCITKTHQKKK